MFKPRETACEICKKKMMSLASNKKCCRKCSLRINGAKWKARQPKTPKPLTAKQMKFQAQDLAYFQTLGY